MLCLGRIYVWCGQSAVGAMAQGQGTGCRIRCQLRTGLFHCIPCGAMRGYHGRSHRLACPSPVLLGVISAASGGITRSSACLRLPGPSCSSLACAKRLPSLVHDISLGLLSFGFAVKDVRSWETHLGSCCQAFRLQGRGLGASYRGFPKLLVCV